MRGGVFCEIWPNADVARRVRRDDKIFPGAEARRRGLGFAYVVRRGGGEKKRIGHDLAAQKEKKEPAAKKASRVKRKKGRR